MPNIYGDRKFVLRRSPKKMGGYKKGSTPVRKGRILKVLIKEVSEKGDGVAKYEDFVIFIPNTKLGERVWIKITEIKKSNAVGKRLY